MPNPPDINIHDDAMMVRVPGCLSRSALLPLRKLRQLGSLGIIGRLTAMRRRNNRAARDDRNLGAGDRTGGLNCWSGIEAASNATESIL